VSLDQIVAELPKLNAKERRQLAREIFALDDESALLQDSDARADANFLILDQMEAEDAARAKTR
jgi:hypothetical protein